MSRPVRRIWILFAGAVLAVIVHNFFSALFGVEDIVFFFLSLACILGLIIFSLLAAYSFLLKKEPKDIWRLGWLGVILTILFLLVGINNSFFYLFSSFFLLFFLTKLKR